MGIRIFMVTGAYVRVPDLTLEGFETVMKTLESRSDKTFRVVDHRNASWSLRTDKISHAIEDFE